MGKEGGTCSASFGPTWCAYAHIVTSGPLSTDMSEREFINETTLHPSGHLQHCRDKISLFSSSIYIKLIN